MSGSFGAQLRQRREEQGIDLIAIAAQTKIKMSLLDALERDDVSSWPSGIFRRAYVRAYAQAIALDPDVVLREFYEVHPEPAEVVSTEAIASAVDSRVHSGPPTRLRYLVGSALGSLARFRRQPGDEPPVRAQMAEPPSDRTLNLQPLAPAPFADPAPQAVDLAEALATEPLTGMEALDAVDEPSPESGVVDVDLAADVEPYEWIEPDSDALAVDLPPSEVVPAAEVTAPTPEPDEYRGPDFSELARLCTRFGQVQDAADLSPLIRELAGVLEAPGVILWLWDPMADGLRAALAHGYSDRVLAQLPVVGRQADNATAAALRTGQTCCTSGAPSSNSALVVPLLTGVGCAGVLAVELSSGREQMPSVRAAATIVAAMLAQLAGAPASSQHDHESEPGAPGADAEAVRHAAAHR